MQKTISPERETGAGVSPGADRVETGVIHEFLRARRHSLTMLETEQALGLARFRNIRPLYETWFWHASVTLPRVSRFRPSIIAAEFLPHVSFIDQTDDGLYSRDVPANRGVFPNDPMMTLDDALIFPALDKATFEGAPVFFTLQDFGATGGTGPAAYYAGAVLPISHDGLKVDRFCTCITRD